MILNYNENITYRQKKLEIKFPEKEINPNLIERNEVSQRITPSAWKKKKKKEKSILRSLTMSSFLEKKMEWHNRVGNPIVPSVWRKKIKKPTVHALLWIRNSQKIL